MASMDTPSTVGPVVVDELKKQAREAGYVVLAVERSDAILYAVYVLGVLLGFLIGSRE